MEINLTTGTLDTTGNLDGWVITSPRAIAEGAEDVELLQGDKIRLNGDVVRQGEIIANIQ
jgi:hypothetical protein